MIPSFMNPWSGLGHHQRVLLLLRIGTGAALAASGYQHWKISRFVGEFSHQIAQWIGHHPIELYRQFMQAWLLPYAKLLAPAIPYTEMALGGLLILGLFTRISAWGVISMSVISLLTTYYLGPAYIGWSIMLLLNATALNWAGAGSIWGLDGIQFGKKPGGKKPGGKKSSGKKTIQLEEVQASLKKAVKSRKKGEKAAR